MVYACFFCRRRTCLSCLRPAPGMLPMCTICWGERTRPALSQPEAAWATRVERMVDLLMTNILNLGSAMIQHERLMEERPGRVNQNTPPRAPDGAMAQQGLLHLPAGTLGEHRGYNAAMPYRRRNCGLPDRHIDGCLAGRRGRACLKRRYHILKTRRAFRKRQFWSIEISGKREPMYRMATLPGRIK